MLDTIVAIYYCQLMNSFNSYHSKANNVHGKSMLGGTISDMTYLNS